MIPSGFIEVDRCKEIVEERLAKRVGMTGEQLDDWDATRLDMGVLKRLNPSADLELAEVRTPVAGSVAVGRSRSRPRR